MRRILLLTVMLAILPKPSTAQQHPAALPELVRRVGGAVVSISVFDASGREVGQATGFLLGDGRVVTNAHTLEGATRVEVVSAKDELLGTATYAVALSSRVDVAVLPRLGKPATYVSLSDDEPDVGEGIVVIGSPRGFANTVSDGIVSAYRQVGRQRLMQITAPISPGSSGSPVIDAEGTVIGMTVGTLPDGQNLNFAIPTRDILAVTGSPPGRVEFPSTTETTVSPTSRDNGELDYEVITVGDVVSGRLEPSDGTIRDGTYFDFFYLSGKPGEEVVIELRSSDFDPYLFVGDADRDSDEYVEDDDSGRGDDARVRTTVPDGGALIVVANAYRVGEGGAYTLSVVRGSEAEKSDRWQSVAETATAEWSYDRESIRPQSNDRYRVWVRADYYELQRNEDGTTYDGFLGDFELDCQGMRYRLFAVHQYRGSEYGWHSDDEPGEWLTWAPESIVDGLSQVVCESGSDR